MQAALNQRRIGLWTLRICVVTLFASLAALVTLNLCDERLESISLGMMLRGRVGIATTSYSFLLPMLAYSLLATLGLLGASIFLGERPQRNLWNLLFLTTMIAVTLALFTNWQRISWEGRRYRMHSRIESLQAVCDALQKDWPTNDMHHDLLGPIMAYPQWNPSTLILLTPKPVDDRFHIAAIDRSQGDVLRFELSSGYETIWLEHRSKPGLDKQFTNGIEQSFTLQYYVAISPNWFLVRYQ